MPHRLPRRTASLRRFHATHARQADDGKFLPPESTTASRAHLFIIRLKQRHAAPYLAAIVFGLLHLL
ncbi:MAG: hypothetical protein C0457_11175 [Polymorphum sp.]|nr:hypothetical protein [Polymorphum sp.]